MTAAARYDPRAGRYVGGRAFGLPAPPLPVPSEAELELLVRFEHPAKFLAVKELPGAALLPDDCLAAAYGCAGTALAAIRAKLAAELTEAADALLAEPGVARALEAVPVRPLDVVVALGDSITDDVQSWAEILRRCLAAVHPGVEFVNAGISGDTTAEALGRLYGIVELRPTLAIGMLGTNDCQLHGPDREPLILPDASRDNVAAISRWLATVGTRVVWLTPPPVDREALRATVGDRPFDVDDGSLARFSESLRASGLEVVDTGAEVELLHDGVHPSLAGQCRIAEAVIRALKAV